MPAAEGDDSLFETTLLGESSGGMPFSGTTRDYVDPALPFSYYAWRTARHEPFDVPVEHLRRSALPESQGGGSNPQICGLGGAIDADWRAWVDSFQETVVAAPAADGDDLGPDFDADALMQLIPADLRQEIEDSGCLAGFDDEEKFYSSADDVNAVRDLYAWPQGLQGWPAQAANGVPNQEETGFKPYGRAWIENLCEEHMYIQSAATGHPPMMSGPALADLVLETLRLPQKNDEVSARLFELLGSENIVFLTELMTNRDTIIATVSREVKGEKEAGGKMDDWKAAREAALLRGPAPMPTGGIVRRDRPTYPHVYMTGPAADLRLSTMVSLFGANFALPKGTERRNERDYEEIILPAAQQFPPLPDAQMISIDRMPKWTRPVYKAGYTALNKVQSLVYPIAFESNENMLVSAPTGAGKTDVAMLTVLRTIGNYILADPNEDPDHPHAKWQLPTIAKKEFKIVYVAPMKALAAEVVEKFSARLKPLGIAVRELTGDMQMTKQEILATQMIVTTPEKWDVVTRKSTGDSELAQKVKLLIIDEVHLLHEDRGTVLETLVARTLRQVESMQTMIRIVGLSATLPNYVDVAQFLGVNLQRGMFYFDAGFRPVPLTQHFLGIKGKQGSAPQRTALSRACFEKCRENLVAGHQVMVFVHSRKDTFKAAQAMREQATLDDALDLFDCTGQAGHTQWSLKVSRSRNNQLKEMFGLGMGLHHAGMLRADRSLTEQLFANGMIKVLFSTATLAWGVNLPAHAVIIRGTDIYDAQKGSFVDLGILDVLQIFGRAGRPQYEAEGVGYILTPYEKMSRYVAAMTQQHPIESQFPSGMIDNLNAEIALGTVSTIEEAVQWLGYTYMYVRMRKNPTRYGVEVDEDDPGMVKVRRTMVDEAAKVLFFSNMIVYDPNVGTLSSKDIGRVASNFYIKHDTVNHLCQNLRDGMTEADVLVMLSACQEFTQIKLRDEETKELDKLLKNVCPCQIRGTAVVDSPTKVNVLLQAFISHAPMEEFSLISDTMYIAQNAARVLRAIFELAMIRDFAGTANTALNLCKCVEHRKWPFVHPLSQFPILPYEIIEKLGHLEHITISALREMTPADVGQLVRNQKYGPTVHTCAWQFPYLEMSGRVAPITATVIELHMDVSCDFEWLDAVHGRSQVWWLWVEGADGVVYHSDQLLVQKTKYLETHHLSFKIPISSPPPTQMHIRWVSDTWIGCESDLTLTLDHMILPDLYTPHTDLLNLNPLPISTLKNPILEQVCSKKFQFFNPIQTQTFHTLYHTRENVLLGAPTGSGKTVAAELAMWSSFRDFPKGKVVYIAPMKALVRERVDDWRKKLEPLKLVIVELTGDVTPDMKTVRRADLIITTPEKWDGVSRGWRGRSYVQDVRCMIIDEIHLLGGERGPILEMIVSRMNYISKTNNAVPTRIVGLSTALANARDLADWLGIQPVGLFNFRHSVRPVQLETYIDGFAGKHYCPRMASMNKPCYAAILRHSPKQPALVFVSSRRQTRLTALDLISYCCNAEQPQRFLNMSDDELQDVLDRVRDRNLAHSLTFGIGLHHAGLVDSDRRIVENLFVTHKIQILIATSTLAWGVNTPAHLVCIKGTEFYDAKQKKYMDMPITDVLQMMGRAGRPGFDDKGVACVFVADSKKNFYKKFLHSPFPVESSLHRLLHDHMNAEIASGTIKSKQDALDFLSWTYFYRRLQKNPTYYDLVSTDPQDLNTYLSKMVDQVMMDLAQAGCVQVMDPEISATRLGEIAAFYYLQYRTLDQFHYAIKPGIPPTPRRLLELLAFAQEYAELPVRHNEDLLNKGFAQELPLPVSHFTAWDSPHLKAHLLLQAHMAHATLPIVDYVTDTVSVLDQSIRVLQAMLDVAVHKQLPEMAMAIVRQVQCIKQAQWLDDSNLQQLPSGRNAPRGVECIAQLLDCAERDLKAAGLLEFAANLPVMYVTLSRDEGKLHVALQRVSAFPAHQTNKDTRIRAPRFPKPQYEGWYVMVVGPPPPPAQPTGTLLGQAPDNGDAAATNAKPRPRVNPQQDISMQRMQFRDRKTVKLSFAVPCEPGSKVYVMCDGYLGMDQVLDLPQ